MQDEKKTFREKWYAELDSNDLRKVWIKGFIVCILAAIVAGFIDYLLMNMWEEINEKHNRSAI